LTYLEPSSWWFKVFRFLGKHQEVDYAAQYEKFGVRLFEFNLYVNKGGRLIAKNGSVRFSIFSFYEILDYLNKMGDAKVLVTLDESFEESLGNGSLSVEKKFKEMCYIIETIYPHIAFFGGTRKFDDKVLYPFDWEKTNGRPIVVWGKDLSLWYRLFSRLVPRVMNKKILKEYEKTNGYLMLDFVNKK
jgi:hypothetical protein